MGRCTGLAGVMLAAIMATSAPIATSAATSKNELALESGSTAAAPDKAMLTLLQSGYNKLMAGDGKGAMPDIKAAMALPAFAAAAPRFRYNTYLMLVRAAYTSGDADASYTYARQAGDEAPDMRDANYWKGLTFLAHYAGKNDAAAETLATFAVNYPDKFNDYSDDLIREIVLKTEDLNDGGAHRLRLLESLWNAHYQPSNAFLSAENIHFALFELYAAKAEDDKARTVMASFREPLTVIRLRADKRYARFLKSDPAHGDFKSALAQYLVDSRSLAAAHPEKLEGQVMLADRLLNANLGQEALTLLDADLAKIKAAPADKPPYDDLNTQMNWLLDKRSEIMGVLGRTTQKPNDAEVEATMVQARDTALTRGSDVISQKVNLADFYYRHGKPQLAIDTLKDLDETRASPYGLMAASEARVCAYAGLGDKAKTESTLDFMRAHSADGTAVMRSALLCAGDLDELAKTIMAQLDNPMTRDATLVDMQNYLPDRSSDDYTKAMTTRMLSVWRRPDVQATVDRYGVIESYPVFYHLHEG